MSYGAAVLVRGCCKAVSCTVACSMACCERNVPRTGVPSAPRSIIDNQPQQPGLHPTTHQDTLLTISRNTLAVAPYIDLLRWHAVTVAAHLGPNMSVSVPMTSLDPIA